MGLWRCQIVDSHLLGSLSDGTDLQTQTTPYIISCKSRVFMIWEYSGNRFGQLRNGKPNKGKKVKCRKNILSAHFITRWIVKNITIPSSAHLSGRIKSASRKKNRSPRPNPKTTVNEWQQRSSGEGFRHGLLDLKAIPGWCRCFSSPLPTARIMVP